MRLHKVSIKNFRNFKDFSIALSENVVLVGENRVGKSNFLVALQLVLDPAMPDQARLLREEDFWDGLKRPLPPAAEIRIDIDIAEFDTDAAQLAVLAEHLIQPEPMIARLSYRLRQVTGSAGAKSTFEFDCFGGNRDDSTFGYETRSRLPMMVLPALRDAVTDLGNWRASPLRPLLETAAQQVDRSVLTSVAAQIGLANSELTKSKPIESVGNQINDQLEGMVGERLAMHVSLGFSPTDEDKLIRAIRMFIDQGRRGVGEASLGSANLLYLTLRALELRHRVQEGTREHTFLGIEEPEAHLHPHLQRLVYREFLRTRAHQEPPHGDAASVDVNAQNAQEGTEVDLFSTTSVLLTTHSPHIVSVSPLRSLALLRSVVAADGAHETIGNSTAGLTFSESEVEDLERYLDVTRGELLFAKGILLVEGDAEAFLLPALAHELGYELDRLGITVCSVSGVHFESYVRLIAPTGLNIPFAVLTDYDPPAGKDGLTPGQRRATSLARIVSPSSALAAPMTATAARAHGVFLNSSTLELALVEAGDENPAVLFEALREVLPTKQTRELTEAWEADSKKFDGAEFLKRIERAGKGRYAQRLASKADRLACPEYLQRAIEHVVALL